LSFIASSFVGPLTYPRLPSRKPSLVVSEALSRRVHGAGDEGPDPPIHALGARRPLAPRGRLLRHAALGQPGAAGGVAATARELSRPLDRPDRAWLSPRRLLERRPAPPADRFNAGQKMNARLLAFGLLGLYATGLYTRQACT
jgi:hypothetical protein